MAIIVRTCCCGCDLRTGILLIGIFGLVSAFYEFVSSRLHVRVPVTQVDGLAVTLVALDCHRLSFPKVSK